MKAEDIETNADAADFVNECDENDTPIYMTLDRVDENINIPVDNYALFHIITAKDPSMDSDVRFTEENDKVFVY